jgi:hypothetical protein
VRELARERGVSQATVVQAYRTLEDARLIEARARSGYFVAARPRRLPEPEPSRPPVASLDVDVSAMASEVMRLATTEDHISFGAACPTADLFDEERVRRAVSRATQRHRSTLCQYPLGPGDESLRRAVARHTLRMGCGHEAKDIVITNSCLESISLCLRAVTKPGDVVALESPTYFGLLEIVENLHLKALEIPTHPRTGISVDALQLAFDTQPVKAVLIVPTLSNPLGACMPLAERRRLAQMVAERGIPLIEDVLYNDLVEQEDKRRAVASFDPSGHVMLCGSFSKTIAPGLRLGWVAPGRWLDKLAHEGHHLRRPGGHPGAGPGRSADPARHRGGLPRAAQHHRRPGGRGARPDRPPLSQGQQGDRPARRLHPVGGTARGRRFDGPVPGLPGRAHLHRAGGDVQRHRPLPPLHPPGRGGRWDDAQRAGLKRVGALACGLAQAPAAQGSAEPSRLATD